MDFPLILWFSGTRPPCQVCGTMNPGHSTILVALTETVNEVFIHTFNARREIVDCVDCEQPLARCDFL